MTENEAKLILDVRISRFDHANDVNEALEVAKAALEEIEDAPTAYDVDKVVEQLEELGCKGCEYADDFEKCVSQICECKDISEQAIEIVKAGVVHE